MAITIEGFTIVAQKDRIEALLADGSLDPPNATALADDDLWRCGFMTSHDAEAYVIELEKLGLNGSRGPDSDVVVVSEFDRSIQPYCEWLSTGVWEKAVIAWKTGTEPRSVIAREGWDPKVGSGLVFQNPQEMDDLEFLRLDGNVEVYLHRPTGKEVYTARTSTPVEALFHSAASTIQQHTIETGGPRLTGPAAQEVTEAVAALEKAVAEEPEWWQAHWYLGKGRAGLGAYDAAYEAFRRAFEIEDGIEAIPRELAGVCLELGRFEEAVTVLHRSASLEPDNPQVLGNLAVAYLLSGQIDHAEKAITAAKKAEPGDRINRYIAQAIADVRSGIRPQPRSLAELSRPAKRKRPWWKFW